MKLLFAVLLALSLPARAQEAPEWFAETLLDLREDVADAAKERKRVMLYFWQEGCPACKRLVETTLRDPEVVARMRGQFASIALNVFGDREVTWTDGKAMSEKQLAAMLKVQATPTLVFLDEKGAVALRFSGYLPPAQFELELDTAAPARGG